MIGQKIEKTNRLELQIEPVKQLARHVLVALGDMYADTCHCGDRAYFGEASQKGPAGCVEAVRSGKVFCDKHIPRHLITHNEKLTSQPHDWLSD